MCAGHCCGAYFGHCTAARYSAQQAPRRRPTKSHSSSNSVFRIPDALKATTLRAMIGAAAPVFGLRWRRSRFWRTANLPKPRRLTSSPATSVETISLRTASISSLQRRRVHLAGAQLADKGAGFRCALEGSFVRSFRLAMLVSACVALASALCGWLTTAPLAGLKTRPQ